MEIITRAEAKAKGLKRYFTGEPCKHGHIGERFTSNWACSICYAERYQENKDAIAERHRKYYQENKESMANIGRKYRQENKESITERKRKYRQENKESITEYRQRNRGAIAKNSRKYYQENKDAIAKKKRKHRKENPIPYFVRGSLSRVISDWKGSREEAEKLLGYTYEQLQQRIESQFKDGMSWDKRSEFHIDHVKPVKAFLDEGITDPAIINALSNLQPLWAHENLSKGAKYDG